MAITKRNKQGGKRSNAGRKPLPEGEKTVQLYVFVKEKYITQIGSDRAKVVALEAIKKEFELPY